MTRWRSIYFYSSRSVLHQGLLLGLRKFLPESLREEYCENPSAGRHNPHDEDRSGEPVDLEQVQQETGDAAQSGHQGAGPDCLQGEREGDCSGAAPSYTWFLMAVGNSSEVKT